MFAQGEKQLETKVIIKIPTQPCQPDLLTWDWNKKNKFFFDKFIFKMAAKKKLIFQNRQFSKNFHENFLDWSLG